MMKLVMDMRRIIWSRFGILMGGSLELERESEDQGGFDLFVGLERRESIYVESYNQYMVLRSWSKRLHSKAHHQNRLEGGSLPATQSPVDYLMPLKETRIGNDRKTRMQSS